MITYQLEDYDQVVDDIQPLVLRNWKEVAAFQDDIHLAPDLTKYKTLYDAGMLFIMTARKDGVLIGYNIAYITENLQYSANKFAQQDVTYVTPECRGTRVALKLIKYTEDVLMSEHNVDTIIYHSNLNCDCTRLLSRLGYKPIETVCMKYVGKGE